MSISKYITQIKFTLVTILIEAVILPQIDFKMITVQHVYYDANHLPVTNGSSFYHKEDIII